MTKEYIEENIITKSGKLNPNLLKKTGYTPEDLYKIYNPEINCECSLCNKKLRFLSFKKGYKKCSCVDFTGIKKEDITKEFIAENMLINNKLKRNIKNKSFYNLGISDEELFIIYHDLKSVKCPFCDKKRKFISFYRGFDKTCNSSKCINKLGEHKRIETCLNKYGVTHTSKLKENREKSFETYHKNYDNFKDNLIEAQSKVDQQKKKIKSRKTKKEKYGEYNYNNSEKTKETCLLKYGVDNVFKLIDRKDKNTNNTYSHVNNLDTYNEEGFRRFIVDGYYNKEQACEYYNITVDALNKIKVRYNIKETNISNIIYIEERINEIFNNSFTLRTKRVISPFELDLYDEKSKFAIEYNGLIWHSYGNSDHSMFNNYKEENKNKHLNKTILCEEKGIQLYHIFENEWLNEEKKDIWISMIKDKQGLNNKIGARKCIIKEVQTKKAREFIDENHMQGYVGASIKIGLYYNDELYSIMTFGKSRYNKNIEYELIRFCTKKGYTIQGGGSKLLKYFENEYKPKSLLSYANRRWSMGNFYIKSGFSFKEDTIPNYFYFYPKENVLWSRNKFQKHKLNGLLEKFNDELTETENMYNNGYRKIYDCGNKVFIKEY